MTGRPGRETSRLTALRTLGEAVLAVTREHQFTVLAAGVAYYAFNSLIPAALLAFIGVSASQRIETAAFAVAAVTGVDAVRLTEILRTVTASPTGQVRATLIAGGVFLWSTGQLLRAIRRAFAALYGTDHRDVGSPLDTAIAVSLAFVTMAVAVLLVVVVGVSLSAVLTGWVWNVASPLLLFVILSALFAPIYAVLPHASVGIREALPGTGFAAATWTASSLVLRRYATTAESVELYGLAGGVLLFLTWLYAGSLFLLLGATLNAVAAGRVNPDG